MTWWVCFEFWATHDIKPFDNKVLSREYLKLLPGEHKLESFLKIQTMEAEKKRQELTGSENKYREQIPLAEISL